jgi:hypothetical protein
MTCLENKRQTLRRWQNPADTRATLLAKKQFFLEPVAVYYEVGGELYVTSDTDWRNWGETSETGDRREVSPILKISNRGWPILSRRLRKGGAAFRWPASVFHPSLGGRPSHRFPLPQDVAR